MFRQATAAIVLFCLLRSVTVLAHHAPSEHALSADINGVESPHIVIVIFRNADIHLWSEEFDHLGLVEPEVEGIVYGNKTFLPLLAVPGLSYRFDERRLNLEIECEPACFPGSRSEQVRHRPRPSPVASGVALNYDLSAQQTAGDFVFGGLGEFRFFSNAGVAESGHLAEYASDEWQFTRLQTAWTFDRPQSLHFLRLGDSIAEGGAWGAPSRFGGIQFGTDLSLDPTFISFPTPGISGEAALASTLDIFIDNTLRGRRDIPAGPFSLTDLPVVTGGGDIRVVATDLLGREQIIVAPFYASQSLLKRDLALYSLEVGVLRRNYGVDSNQYREGFVTGTYRRGLTDWLTAEIRGEMSDVRRAAGFGLAFQPGLFGVAELAGAVSEANDRTGQFLRAGYSYTRGPFGIGIVQDWASSDFRRIGEALDRAPVTSATRANIGIELGGWGSVAAGYARQERPGSADFEALTASYSHRLGTIGHLNLSAFRDLRNDSHSLVMTATAPLGPRTTAIAGLQHETDNRLTSNLGLFHQPPPAGGLGGHLMTTQGDRRRQELGVFYDSPYAVVRADFVSADTGNAARLGLRGSLAMIEDRVAATRFSDGAMALVDVSGFPDVGILKDNQQVARTGASGKALIAGLRPYQRNTIAIDPLDLPPDVEIGNFEVTVIPRRSSGVHAHFKVRETNAALVTVLQENGEPLPPGTRIVSLDSGERFTAGYRGRAYLSGLDRAQRFRAEWSEGACAFSFGPIEPDAGHAVTEPVICRETGP